jgi:outer membrane autotransporter protein
MNPPAGSVNPGTKLTVAGAIAGAATSSVIALLESQGGQTYNVTVGAKTSNVQPDVAGIAFFLQNSVLLDLNGQAIGYTSNFVTDTPIVTPLTVSSASVPLGLAGVISGTGGLSITDGGSATLSAANTYTGPTVVAAGGKLFLAGPGSIAASSLTVDGMFDISRSASGATVSSLSGSGLIDLGSRELTINHARGTFAGAIADGGLSGGAGGGLLLAGGTQTLTGPNTYSGGTVIEGGTLIVGNPHALGTGNVIVEGGILATDPQPINVRGNYTQSAGGTLQLNVAGGNPGQYDTLNVSGNAVLGGTLQLISLGFHPKAGSQLTLLSTGGLVLNRFVQFVDPFATGPGFSIAALVYQQNSVLLEFLNFASFALTSNQRAAANLLDAVHLDPTATNLISFVDQEPFANLPGDFEKISPEGLTAFYEISFSNSNIQRLNLEGRLDDLHNGSNGFSSNMRVNSAPVNLEDRADANGISSKAVLEPVLEPAPENRWGVWVTGFGDFVNVDGDGNAQGYNFTTGGVSVGVDYRITDQLAIGLMGDYSHSWTSLDPSGNIDVNSGRGGLYATWYYHGIYLDAAIYAGHNSYNSSRSGLDGLADGNTGGTEWSTFLSGGYDFHFGPLTVGPVGALQYTYANVSGFSENGSLAPMQIQSDSADSLRTDVGFRFFYQWQIGKVLLEPSLKAAWEHEYLYSALPITAGFAGVPGPSATFFGPSEGHDSAIVRAGVSAQWTPALTVYVNYEGQLARGNYDSNAVTGGVSISF